MHANILTVLRFKVQVKVKLKVQASQRTSSVEKCAVGQESTWWINTTTDM